MLKGAQINLGDVNAEYKAFVDKFKPKKTTDEYIIRIRSLDGKDTGTYYVEKEVYDECEIGIMFEYDKERGDLKDEPLTKKEKKQ